MQKGLAPSNAAVWREHITAADAADARACAAPAHATTLRSRNQWIARWSRRWNIRRGFFKPGERLPLDTRRAKAAFPSPFAQTQKKGVQKTDAKRGPREACTQGPCPQNGLLFFESLRCFSQTAPRLSHFCTCPGDCSVAVAQFLGSTRSSWSHRGAHQHGRNVCAARPRAQHSRRSCSHIDRGAP